MTAQHRIQGTLGILASVLLMWCHQAQADDQLLDSARAARWTGSYMEHEADVIALGVRGQVSTARAILREHQEVAEIRLRALALAVLYEHAARLGVGDKKRVHIRGALQDLARDVRAPGYARNQSLRVLLTSEWSGRDRWYETLLSDTTLRNPGDGHFVYSPLNLPVDKDPERWVPRLIPLLKSPGAVRSNVAHILARLLDQAKAERPVLRDAAVALLPWLSDRNWATRGNRHPSSRAGYISSLGMIHIEAAIPGLIHVVETERDYVGARAAGALQHYGDPRAVPALREALRTTPRRGWQRQAFLQAITACGGFSAKEATRALEAYARAAATPAGLERVRGSDISLGQSTDNELALGVSLAHRGIDDDAIVKAVIKRIRRLRRREPAVAHALERPLFSWRSRAALGYVVSRLATEKLDDRLLRSALEQRSLLAQNDSPGLRALVRRGGVVAGRAAAILGHANLIARVLSGSDPRAILGLLQAAEISDRRQLDPSDDWAIGSHADDGPLLLPIASVGPLLTSADTRVVVAARAWLKREGGPNARSWLATGGTTPAPGADSVAAQYCVNWVCLGMTRQQVEALKRNPGADQRAIVEYSSDDRVSAVAGQSLQIDGQNVVGYLGPAADVRYFLGRADKERSGHVQLTIGGFFWLYTRHQVTLEFAFVDDRFTEGLRATLHQVRISTTE